MRSAYGYGAQSAGSRPATRRNDDLRIVQEGLRGYGIDHPSDTSLLHTRTLSRTRVEGVVLIILYGLVLPLLA